MLRFKQTLIEGVERYTPKGTRNWWKKMSRADQVAYRKRHPRTSKTARYADIHIDRETLNK
jgi:hypothetical protein